MKKLIYLLSITFLLLQSCSSGDSDNNTNTTTVSDVDGNVYQRVTICNQTWTKSNLNVSHYRNGDEIPQVTDPTQWKNLTTGAWCYYNNLPYYGNTYGKLYNWYAITDPRGIAPEGWHIPSDAEWTILRNCVGGFNIAGSNLKEIGNEHWFNPNYASNESGFTALPGCWRQAETGNFQGQIGSYCFFWSSDEYQQGALSVSMKYNSSSFGTPPMLKNSGFSIRCVKN